MKRQRQQGIVGLISLPLPVYRALLIVFSDVLDCSFKVEINNVLLHQTRARSTGILRRQQSIIIKGCVPDDSFRKVLREPLHLVAF
jgi:hypothetical protein